ncbi:hypothetical protein PDQ32_28285 [Bacillus cereus]|nr:hypothetical protein [Bacillus cereus]MDA2561464.1 hypothetical protein [Bacillus cereus]
MGLVKPFPTIETKTKRLPQTTERPLYYKVARIQSRNPVDSGEGSVLQGQLYPQSNFGFTGTAQPLYTFSFGVRNGGPASLIKPSLLKVGDSREDSYRFEVYKDPEGFHILYLVLSPYSRGGVIVYHSIECKEYFEVDMEFTERGYTLVWSSVTGDTQGVYEGGRRLLTESKAEELYLKKNTIGFRQVTLDPANGFYHRGDGLLYTKRGDIVTLFGDLLHGNGGAYKIVGRVPKEFAPLYETVIQAMYSKADSTYGSQTMIVDQAGQIIQMENRVNGDPNATNTKISGTWQCAY